MAYDKQSWKTGDVVTSGKLNHMEDGIAGAGGGGVLIVTDTNGALNKTWQEIHDADFAVIKNFDEATDIYAWFITDIFEDSGDYGLVAFTWTDGTKEYLTDSASGYPTASGSGGGQ